MEEKLVEILCDAKENYAIDNDETPRLMKIEGLIEVICNYRQPVRIRIKSPHINKTNKYILEKAAELHNNLIYANKKIEEYETEIRKVLPLLEKLRDKK